MGIKVEISVPDIELCKTYEIPGDTCVLTSKDIKKATKSHEPYQYLYIFYINKDDTEGSWYPFYIVKCDPKDGYDFYDTRYQVIENYNKDND